VIRDRDPDVIEGHNIYKFDLDYLRVRAEKYGVKLAWGRDGTLYMTTPSAGDGRSSQDPNSCSGKVLRLNDEIRDLAGKFKDARNFLYLGRGYQFPVALEGALKLKEVSYIHAEGYPAAEMKHGPIALIDDDMPVVVLAPRDAVYTKVVSNIEEVKARHGKIIAVVSDDAPELQDKVDYMIKVPHTIPCLLPVLTTVPLQLLAYHTALLRGCDVDQPRNLAKSVTVE